MPTSTLGIVIDSQKISDIMGVANATLGDFKPLFFILLGGWIAFFVISFIIGLVRKDKSLPGVLTTRKERIRKSYDVEAETAGFGYLDDDDDYDDDDDDDDF
ncbi:MAG: hypothetical protein WC310_05875 [Patescibacteria group bacterium]|jgi:hypothetical protein